MKAIILDFPDGTTGICSQSEDWIRDASNLREALERTVEDRSGTRIAEMLATQCKPILQALEVAMVRRLKAAEVEPAEPAG